MAKITIAKRTYLGIFAAGLFGATAMPMEASAQAMISEGCANLAQNVTWMEGISALRKAVDEKEYEAGLQKAAELTKICSESPVLNYYVGMAIRGTGDNVKSLIYFQKATQYMSEFSVTPEFSRRIWYARYEGEYPDRTEDAVTRNTKENARLTEENTNLRDQLARAERAIEDLNLSKKTAIEQLNAEAQSRYATTMWTGVGLGIAGILVGVGGGLLTYFVDNVKHTTSDNTYKPQISPEYITGWAMLGGGIGLTLAGVITAGIGGWQYTHVGTAATPSDDVTLSFQVTGNGAVFGMTF